MSKIEILDIDEVDYDKPIPTFRMKVKLIVEADILIHRQKLLSYNLWYYIRINNPQEWELYFIRDVDSQAQQVVKTKIKNETREKIKQKYKEIYKEEMFKL